MDRKRSIAKSDFLKFSACDGLWGSEGNGLRLYIAQFVFPFGNQEPDQKATQTPVEMSLSYLSFLDSKNVVVSNLLTQSSLNLARFSSV